MTTIPLQVLAVIALLLDEGEEANDRKLKWGHEAWKKRKIEGECTTRDILYTGSRSCESLRITKTRKTRNV
jgi:hypothetical protein